MKSYFLSPFLAVIIVVAAGGAYADESAGNPDVTYFAVVKNHVFAQDWHGSVSETGYSFLAYIFVHPESQIADAWLTWPAANGRREAFPDFRRLDTPEEDTYLFINSGRIYTDKNEYDRDYPNGEYSVEFKTSAGAHRARLAIDGDYYPRPAVMTVYQSGEQISPGAVDPGQDLRVTWGGFPQGKADPNGILDDVVFVIVKNCHGGKVLHSGRPYQGFHLLYTDQDYVVPAGTMLPGRNYELIVDNGIVVDSNRDAGVPGVGFYAQTIKMPLVTSGEAESGADCAIGDDSKDK